LFCLTLDADDINMVEFDGIDPVKLVDALSVCGLIGNADIEEPLCIRSNVRDSAKRFEDRLNDSRIDMAFVV